MPKGLPDVVQKFIGDNEDYKRALQENRTEIELWIAMIQRQEDRLRAAGQTEEQYLTRIEGAYKGVTDRLKDIAEGYKAVEGQADRTANASARAAEAGLRWADNVAYAQKRAQAYAEGFRKSQEDGINMARDYQAAIEKSAAARAAAEVKAADQMYAAQMKANDKLAVLRERASVAEAANIQKAQLAYEKAAAARVVAETKAADQMYAAQVKAKDKLIATQEKAAAAQEVAIKRVQAQVDQASVSLDRSSVAVERLRASTYKATSSGVSEALIAEATAGIGGAEAALNAATRGGGFSNAAFFTSAAASAMADTGSLTRGRHNLANILGPTLAAALGGAGGGILAGGGGGGGGPGGGGGGGSILGGFIGGAFGGLGGNTASGQWRTAAGAIATWYPRIHWAMMLTNEVLATAGPAAVAALAATAVGTEGGQTGFSRLNAINAVGQSIGPSMGTTPGQYLGLGHSLQSAQTMADPMVWELGGAAINAVTAGSKAGTSGLQDFWQMGLNTIAMMDQFGAKVDLNFQHGLGQTLSQAVTGGTQDLQQFGDVLGNVGDVFKNVIPSLPGVGGDLLSILGGATKGLAVGTGLLGHIGGLGEALSFEAGSRYGPALVGGVGQLIGRVGQGLSGAGATGIGGILGTAERSATEADVAAAAARGETIAVGDTIKGKGLAGILGGMGAIDIGAIAGAAYLADKAVTYQTPYAQAAGAATAKIGGSDSFTQAFSGIMSTINQYSAVASQIPHPGYAAQAAAPITGWWQDIKKGDIPGALKSSIGGLIGEGPATNQQAAAAAISTATQQFQTLTTAGNAIAKVFKVSVPEAFTIADQAGLRLNSVLQANGQMNPVALQQIVNTQTGLSRMTGGIGSPMYSAGVNAIQIASGLSGSQLSTLTSSRDQLLQNAAGGSTAATAFSSGIQAMQALGEAMPSSVTPAATKASAKAVAKALTGFTSPASQAAWSAFSNTSTTTPGILQTIQGMMDSLTIAQASGVLGPGHVQGATAYELKGALSYAQYSPAALSQLGLLGQDVGLNTAYNTHQTQAQNFQRISSAIDHAAQTSKEYNRTQNAMTEGMSNVSKQAQNFSSVMSTDVNNTIAGAAASLPKVTAATTALTEGLDSKNVNVGALKTLVDALKGAGESSQSIGLMVGDIAQLHGISGSQLKEVLKIVGELQMPKIPKDLKGTYDLVPHVVPPKIPKPADQSYTIVGHVVIEGGGVTPYTPAGGKSNLGPAAYTQGSPHAAPQLPKRPVVLTGHQTGGKIPGYGGGDIVPAMLEPGEAVVPKHLVSTLAPFLAAHGVPGFTGMSGAADARALIQKYGSIQNARSVLGFAAGGVVPPGASKAQIQGMINTDWTHLDALYSQGNQSAINAYWKNVMDPLYAALDKLKGSAASTATATTKAAQSTSAAVAAIDNLNKALKADKSPFTQFGQQLERGMLAAIHGAPSLKQAQNIANKVNTEVNYAMGVASAAKQGQGYNAWGGGSTLLSTFSGLATPQQTSGGQPYQYYVDQAAAASPSGQPISVQQQMGDYLQAMKSFQGDLGKLSKAGLNKNLMQQLIAAGPLQGDQEAQSILSGAGGAKGANQLWSQINQAANQLGIGTASSIYGAPQSGKGGQLAGDKRVQAGVNANAAPVHQLQAAINSLHGKTVTIKVAVDTGSGGGGGGAGFTKNDINNLVKIVQTKVLEQAKRNRGSNLTLRGYGS